MADIGDAHITAELGDAGFSEAEEIGRGGFGVVYRCVQPSLDRTVAVKVLTADLDRENLERFLREQRAMGRLSGHPNIVDILQTGVTGSGRPYIVMPYHRRRSLDALLRAGGPMDWQDVLAIGVKLAGALETAHRLGTLHRDVKPANVLLSGFDEPQLTDFGIARVAGGFETSTGMVTGSPAFTAPEVLTGRTPTPAADVYSLGSTLFCLLTGHAAFERRQGEKVVAQFLRVTTQPVPDLRGDGVPADLATAIEWAMSVSPADRPPTAAAFGDALRDIQRSHGLRVDDMAVADDLEPAPSDATAAYHPVRDPTGRRSRRTARRTITPPVPETRFRPPTAARTLVDRGRLVETMRIGERPRLTVVHAPAGYGKSTLAAQWRDALTADGAAVAWLTVADDDNNVVWFLAHLVEAIRRVAPTLGEELALVLEEHGDEARDYVLTSLVNEIHTDRIRIGIVVDDWHRVTDPATVEALSFLLDNGCHHLQVLVTTRTVTGLPTGRMRMRGELVEIDSAALRFDTTESQRMLVELGGLSLSDRDVAALTESTDGWVAALQLAALSLRENVDTAELLDSISGRHQAIAEYLAENVLDTLDSDTLDFMLATSVPARVRGDLATELTGNPRGEATLEAIERRDLFLHRVDDDRDWFRYHALFTQYLRRRLRRDHPDRVPGLHRGAARWFAAHDMLSEAVDHALMGDDPELAVDLVEAHGPELVHRAHLSTLLGLVGKLPPALATSRPRLQLSVAWSNAQLLRATAAHTALGLVHTALEQGEVSQVDAAAMTAEADVVAGVTTVMTERRPDGAGQLLDRLREHVDSLPAWQISLGTNIVSLTALQHYDFTEVRRVQRWAARFHEQNSNPYGAVYGYCYAGIAANEELDIDDAEQNFRAALAHAARTGGMHSHIARLSGALLGNLLYQRGSLAEAERLIDETVATPGESASFEFRPTTLGVGPKLRILLDTLSTRARALWGMANRAEPLTEPAPSADSGRPAQDEPSAPTLSGLARYIADVEELATVRALAADGAAEEACGRAQAIVDRLTGLNRPRALLESQALLAACQSAAGRTAEAKNTLAPVAATCARLGLVRLLLDEGPAVVDVLDALAAERRGGTWHPDWPPIPDGFLERVLDAAEPDAPAEPDVPAGPGDRSEEETP
ncbi:serine/threonine-protein kinase [Rhodococcus olei]|uniref:Serine/threonine-protein kinase PknK n=1 Tax=Rhodococcus olei TaxID=2161675 RepID=A0ABP8NUM5_9NOCA